MPTTVRAHPSHSASGKPIRVKRFRRNGPEHSAKWKRLVRDLERRDDVDDPYAVATAQLGSESYAAGEPKRTLSDRLLGRSAEEGASVRRYKQDQRALKANAASLRASARAVDLQRKAARANERARRQANRAAKAAKGSG